MKKDGSLLILKGLEGNEPAHVLTPLQELLDPYVPQIQLIYTVLFFATPTFLIVRFILIPLLAKRIKEPTPTATVAQHYQDATSIS